MTALLVGVVWLVAACSSSTNEPFSVATTSPADLQAEVDASVNEWMVTVDDCDELARGLVQREEDLAREAAEPGYIPPDRLPVVVERVELAKARMVELDCP